MVNKALTRGIVLGLCVALAGCTSGATQAPAASTAAGSASAAPASAEAPSAAPASQPATGCASGPVSVGELPKLDTDPYFQSAFTGMQAAAAEIGGSAIKQAPSQATGEAQIPFINNFVTNKIGVIAIAGNDANSVAPALKRAMAQGVHVVSFDSDVAPDARTVMINQVDFAVLGDLMLDSMYGMIGGSGEFAILSSTPTATNQNAWIAAIKSHLTSDPKYAQLKLDTVVYGQESEQVNQQQALGLVQAYPNLKGIIIPAGIGLPAAARALEAAGLIGKVKLTGLAPASIMKKYILDGSAQDIWWSVPDLGYLTYYAAQAVAQCKITGKQGETFTAGKLGTFTVGANGVVVLGPATIVTKDNIDKFPF
jgi:rhamnose transport system substrate-binding protein